VMVRQPQPDLAASVVLRSATTAAAKLLSRECADRGVTVNCVASEARNATAASFVNGTVLTVDGGRTEAV